MLGSGNVPDTDDRYGANLWQHPADFPSSPSPPFMVRRGRSRNQTDSGRPVADLSWAVTSWHLCGQTRTRGSAPSEQRHLERRRSLATTLAGAQWLPSGTSSLLYVVRRRGGSEDGRHSTGAAHAALSLDSWFRTSCADHVPMTFSSGPILIYLGLRSAASESNPLSHYVSERTQLKMPTFVDSRALDASRSRPGAHPLPGRHAKSTRHPQVQNQGVRHVPR